MRHMAGASNKVFEYLSHGVAPLVSDLPDWRSTFVDPGYALACDPSDVRSIAGTLGLALKNRDALRAVAERGYERLCADWNYESQFAPVLEAMTARPASTFRRAALEDRQEAQCAF
jgi:glycosyltransferase involved in cell wall biosynthesis